MAYNTPVTGAYGPNNPTILRDDANENVSVGKTALASITSGSDNTAMGNGAGSTQNNLTSCTFLGSGADASVGGLINACAIGANASVSTDNTIVLGSGCAIQINNFASVLTKWLATAQTVGATSTTLLSIPIPTNTEIMVNVNIVARLSTSASAAYGSSSAAALNNAGTVTAVGTLPSITFTNSGLFVVTAMWSTSGTNLVLTVTGIALDTINWAASYEYFNV